MLKSIKNFLLSLFCILLIQLLFSAAAFAAANGFEPNSSGLFDNQILLTMQQFLLKTYQSICKLLMVGHALMCYAVNVDYSCIIFCKLAQIPNLNFLLVGLAIYCIGIFVSVSIGMYFIDISFKLGFAIIFMPITMALWPFPPTKNKFGENLSTIIRNSMLFLMASIGIAFCIRLINAGLLDGGEDVFWEAIENSQSEKLTASFSLFSVHILVIFFSIIYGLKLLTGSVKNYLSSFFSDSVFGSESPMHMMGTQAVGTLSEYTVKPVASFAKDVAYTQTGKALYGVGSALTVEGRQQIRQNIGNGITKIKSNFRQAVRGTSQAIQNPHEAYNNAMQQVARSTNGAIQSAGKGLQSVIDNATLFAPIPMRESWRQALLNKVNGKDENGVHTDGWIDKGAQKLGNVAEKAIATGGGVIKEKAKQGAAVVEQKMHNMTHSEDEQISVEQAREKLHQDKTNLQANVKGFAQGAAQVAEEIEDVAVSAGTSIKNTTQKAAAYVEEKAKQGAAATEKALHNVTHSAENQITTEQARERLHQDKETIKQGITSIKEMYNTADQAPVSLAPSKLLAAPFKAVLHPVDTIEKVANNIETLQGADKKLIIKKSGQVVFRTIKDTKNDVKKTTQGAGNVLGKVLMSFGKDMQDSVKNEKNRSISQIWADRNRELNEKQREEAEGRALWEEYDPDR